MDTRVLVVDDDLTVRDVVRRYLERADRFENELIICAHLSTRYHPQEVRRIVEAKLPPRLKERVRLWL